MSSFTGTPVFGITLTLTAFFIGTLIYRKTGWSVLNPVITASALIIAVLVTAGICLEDYQIGGRMISFMLLPATTVLAVPLYRKISILKEHIGIILAGIVAGSAVSISSVIFMSRLLGLPSEITASIIPKSITTPIAVEVSESIGGVASVTALAVIFTGIFGAAAGPFIFKFIRSTDSIEKGLAMGTSAHAIGTSRALEMGETEGAMSSLAIGLAGIVTVVLVSLFF